MTNEQFLQQFGHFIEAPNGIQKLRELILQLAVQGKLVEQDPSDVPASELLKQIQAKKAKLVAEGKIKKGKSLPEIAEDEKPLVLPMGWAWSHLGAIGNIFNGNSINAREKETKYAGASGLPYIATKDVGYGRDELDYENGIRIPLTEEKFKIARKGSVLICAEGGSAGKKCGVTNQDICFGNKLFANEPYGKIPSSYLLYLYLSPLFKTLFADCMTGIIGGVSIAKFIELPIPLPPLPEQHRIVAKVDELMALCDQLEAERNARKATHQRLIRAVHPLTEAGNTSATTGIEQHTAWHRIRDNFADLYTTLESVQALRQTILQLAVQGKLVPQDPNDEHATISLSRSKDKKQQMLNDGEIKKGKTIPSLDASNLPYQLPDGWEWASFDDIVNIVGGVTKGRKLKGRETGNFPYLRVANVQRGWLDLEQMKEIELPLDELEKYSLKEGDLLITEGGDWDKVGRTAIWHEEISPCLHQNHVFRARVIGDATSRYYLMLYLNSPVSRDYFAGSSKQTTNLASINMTQLRSAPIPVPPTAEQHRIVTKVDELMALCDQLESNIRDKNDTATRYAEAIVQQIAAA